MPISSDRAATLGAILAEVKRASAHKAAEAPREVGVSTGHPTKSVDAGTQDNSEGERSREWKSEIKDQHQVSVEHATGAVAMGQREAQPGVGPLEPREVGDDPAHEDDYKDRKNEAGVPTSAPADAEGDARGDKYSSYLAMDDEKRAAAVADLGQRLVARVAIAAKEAAAQPTTPTPAGAAISEASQAAAVKAGYDAAMALVDTPDSDALELCYNTVKQAQRAAALTAQFVYEFAKEAAEGMADEDLGALPPEGGPEIGADAGAMPPAGPAPDGVGLEALLGGGGGAMSPEPTPSGPEELNAALAELGISPEEAVALLMEQLGGAPGAAPGGDAAAALEPAKAAAWARHIKAAAEDRRQGRWSFRPARGPKAAALRAKIKDNLMEITGRRPS